MVDPVQEKLKQELTVKADSTFLWVALVFKELEEVPIRKILACYSLARSADGILRADA